MDENARSVDALGRSTTVEEMLAARTVAHGSILRVLVASAIERDPSLEEKFASIVRRDLEEIEDEAIAALVECEFRSIIG